jgi:hypothetical protein
MARALAATDQETQPAPESARAMQRQHRFLVFVLVVSVAVLWLPQLPSSLWLDEAYVYAWIRDGFSQALERGHLVSSVYVVVVWVVKELFGSREWLLRLPSLLAAGLTLLFLVRLGTSLVDRETGLLAAIVFATDGSVVFAATDARPYAFALLATVAAFYCLVRWLSSGSRPFAVAYALLASAAVYCHLLFAVMYAVHGFCLWRERSRGPWVNLRTLCAVAALTGLLLLPLTMELLRHVQDRQVFSFSGSASVYGLATVSLPPVIVFGLLIGVVVAGAVGSRPTVRWPPPKNGSFAYLAAWALLPPSVLFLVSLTTAAKLFVPRYALSAIPGLALLVACVIRSIAPARARRIVVEALAFLSVLGFFSRNHGAEDWRSAATAAQAYTMGRSMPVLVRSGTIESRDLSWLVDSEKRMTTLAPLTYYRVDGDLIPLPWDLESQPERDYMERIVSEHIVSVDRFLLISRTVGDNGTVAAWLRGRLGPLGFCARSLGNFGAVGVLAFDRTPSACGEKK